ncbi:MAG: ribosome-associated translation inhibitor RaiA [Candidatus Magasanikbacteria bacterium]|nr:ribosome-associated translation inhibitor RaiA [Candidatus Magasanikbacteria bacterium]
MQLIISGKGLGLTDAIENYVAKKINPLEKFFKGIIRADVTLGKETKHRVKGEIFYAECKLAIPGNDIFEREGGKDLYSAIDGLKDGLEVELKRRKAKLHKNDKKIHIARRSNKEYQD